MKYMKKIFEKNKYVYYIAILFYFILVALFNQYLLFGFDIKQYLNFNITIFFLFWIFTFIIIRMILPNKIGRWLMLAWQIVLCGISIANYFYIGYFDSIFSWQDIVLGGEGFSFISSIFPLINFKIILVVICIVFLIVFTTIVSPNEKKVIDKKSKIFAVIGGIIYLTLLITYLSVVINLSKPVKETDNKVDSREVFGDNSYFYREWVNSKIALRACGIYEYLMRDLYLLIFSKDSKASAKEYVAKNINDHKQKYPIDSKYYSLFKDKNLILVMMESVDDWEVNEFSAPTITMMKNKGIDFTNHHSLVYVTGKTAQSEFMANTGIYPKFNSLTPHYAYVNNNYKFSLPNLFKKHGYTVNSFHRTFGHIYNREKMMLSLGYEHYYNIGSFNIPSDEIDLDSSFIDNAYDLFVQGDKFMDFYLTFSNHPAYTKDKIACSKNYDIIKKHFPDEKDETLLCGYAQMYETDLFFKQLLEKLEKDDLLDDTVIMGFSDHPNGQFVLDGENAKNNYTEMFIYNPNINHKEISKLTNTINILPMINTLFALDSPYFMASYDPLTSDDNYLIYNDYTIYENKKFRKMNSKELIKVDMSKNILISDYYNNKK